LIAIALTLAAARAAEPPKCVGAHLVLWGDGKHDDTAALNAWFAGETVVWGETQQPVGPEIAGRDFLLSSAVYVPSGSGRRLERFEMIWPHRGERVSGGAILSGTDPDAPPVASGITKVNGDPGEGVPYEAPVAEPDPRAAASACLVS
jgi:hypothetical protein